MNTLSKKQYPSDLELAESIENFELSIAKQQIKDLEQQIKDQQKSHFDELAAVKKGEGVITDPIAHAIALLESVPAMQSLIQSQQDEIVKQNGHLKEAVDNFTEVKDALVVAIDAGKQLRADRDKAHAQFDQIHRITEGDRIIITNLRAELKELKALNPKKLLKQNKELQAKNRDLNEANTRNRKVVIDLQKSFKSLEQDYSKLLKQKEAMDAGFTKLHADIESGRATDVLYDKDNWQICSDGQRFDKLYIVDKRNDSCRVFEDGEVAKANPIPQSVKDQALIILAHNKEAAKSLNFQGAA